MIKAQNATISDKEIEHFAKDSAFWWDEDGPFKPLHRLNPVRMSYIRDQVCKHFDLDHKNLKPLKDLKILDVGCGGGLVCESLARMGADVTGIDADENAIHIAKDHAEKERLTIKYICASNDMLIQDNSNDVLKAYDVVLGLEIIEHVPNPKAFVENNQKLATPNGLLIFSTLNRTVKSYLLGIAAAEYILQWVPKGTHNWDQFVKPSEFVRMGRHSGLKETNISGLVFNPIKNIFELSSTDIDVNYLITFKNLG